MASNLKRLFASISIVAMSINIGAAHAEGTLVGTSIRNDATVGYQVGGVPQNIITASDIFAVDRKIIFTLSEDAPVGTTTVVPGQIGAVTTFVVTNTSNDTLDFFLGTNQYETPTIGVHGGTDVFDMNLMQTFVDANNNNVYDSGIDVSATIENLAPDANIRVFVIGDIPISQINGDVAGVQLIAWARNSDGTIISAVDDTTVNSAGVETIFADTDRDGYEFAGDDYTVGAPVLSVNKYSHVVSDGVSDKNPKAIPGAIVEYCIVVSNAVDAATANDIIIRDNLFNVANASFFRGFDPVNGTYDESTGTCTPGIDIGNYDTATGIVSSVPASVVGGSNVALIFQVTID